MSRRSVILRSAVALALVAASQVGSPAGAQTASDVIYGVEGQVAPEATTNENSTTAITATVAPATVNFGVQKVGVVSTTMTVTLANPSGSTGALSVTGAPTFPGADSSRFGFLNSSTCGTLTGTTWTPTPVPAGSTCRFELVSLAVDKGPISATFTIQTNADTNNVKTIPLSAEGRYGYYLATASGQLGGYGPNGTTNDQGASLTKLAQPIVGVDRTTNGEGVWRVARDGGVFASGDADFFGSTGATRLNQPIVGIAQTGSDGGYWLVASDGGVFSFGDAKFYGSTGALKLNQPIVGMAGTSDGNGYWLVARDGGVFSFGNAEFYGSTGALTLNQPIVGMAATSLSQGYWMVAADGGIFAFGDAPFEGGAADIGIRDVIGIAPTSPQFFYES